MRERNNSIPRFQSASLTTPNFRWLHEEAWDGDRTAEFCHLRQAMPVGLYAPLPYLRADSKHLPARPVIAGRWLLVNGAEGAEAAVACVEAQAQVTHYTTVFLLVSGVPGGWTERLEELALMISGVILLTRADLVRIVPLKSTAAQELAALQLGQGKELWTPTPFMAWAIAKAPQALRLNTVTIDPYEWWEGKLGAEARKTLAYLEKRLGLTEGQKTKPRVQSRLGILGRMTRFLRWD